MPRSKKTDDPDAVRSRVLGIETGKALVELQAERGGQEIKYQDDHVDATVDALTAVLHYAVEMGFDTDEIAASATEHFDYEQQATGPEAGEDWDADGYWIGTGDPPAGAHRRDDDDEDDEDDDE